MISRYAMMIAKKAVGNPYGIFGYGNRLSQSMTNLVSNTGVVSTNTTGVGTARSQLAACSYGS